MTMGFFNRESFVEIDFLIGKLIDIFEKFNIKMKLKTVDYNCKTSKSILTINSIIPAKKYFASQTLFH